MLTLGIDPGTATTGFGLVRQQADKLAHVSCGVITTTPKESTQDRLRKIHAEIKQLIATHKPTHMAVERLFFGTNTKTAIAVAQARGIVLLTAAECGVPVIEYTPLEVKVAVTGYGKAEKKQIQQMVKLLLKMPEVPRPDDAADALAVAICHLHSHKMTRVALSA
ncbi:MAG: crossover junction endodeoxyribonuclease RuvC [Candidatus Margulisbacteria bacterium]|jgi:crossover junction endodeoxyribonuclease RuvC|nr:crossover junction endodeoxyribonuclease RuvC [Candidatus Margulisiibacteriota bacterium]